MQQPTCISTHIALSPSVRLLSKFIFDTEDSTYFEAGHLEAIADAVGLYCERTEFTETDDLLITALTALIDDLIRLCHVTGIPTTTVFQNLARKVGNQCNDTI